MILHRHPSPATPRLSISDLSALVRTVAADESLWLPQLQFPRGSERWWTRLLSDAGIDVWLLSWLPGHSTDLHDHGPSAAAFAVVRGRLSELRQRSDGRLHAVTHRSGSITALAPGVLHDVHGSGREPAASIHAYSPPLHEMNYYELDRRGAVRRTRSVRSSEPELASA
jgi:mannose-6-phosphate isomerase-like protein (cupin superfamily)